MKTSSGRITVVQEGRFLFEEDNGGHRLFITGHQLNFNPKDLRALSRSKERVTIAYGEPEHLVAAVAHSIRRAAHGASAPRDGVAPHHGIGASVRGFFHNWSLPRQLRGEDADSLAARSAESQNLKPRLGDADNIGTSICSYCAVGCAQLVYAKGGTVIAVEGDPRSPINQGTLCPKGAATLDLLTSPLRLNHVLYRAPRSDHWEAKPLDWAMDRIAHLVKQTRDETFVEQLPDGTIVNHTLGVGALGGATLDNEENYLIKKLFAGGLGMVWIENQARVCHSASVPSLGATYGRGAATMPQWELANSDCVVVMGSNMAENHPIAFRFVMQAKAKGATVIHVDPRFTRTSALADIYAPIRTGSDIAFLGGIIRYLLENDLWFKEYALEFTNIATIIDERFRDADELDGFFSGWNEKKGAYQYDSWQYEGEAVPSSLAEHSTNSTESFSEKTRRMEKGPPPQDRTLRHPNCVYQIMRRHYARYTPEMVARVTGCPKETFIRIAETLAKNSGRRRTGAFCYAVAWTHHTTGVQIIRAAAIIQGLLGNTGRPGGGILALRGHCSIQGSTDIPSLYNMLPTYLPQPKAYKDHKTFDDYLRSETTPTGWWHNFPKYAVSLLKAWYGHTAQAENEWGYQWLPKIVGDHSQLPMTLAMHDGIIRGMMFLGQNPVIGGSNSRLIERGLANLEWMVVRDITETETAGFWRSGQLVRMGEVKTEDIKTEVFLMPGALAGEKGGTFTNTHRLVQWHDKVVDGPGDNRSELWFVHQLGKRLKALYADSKEPKDAALQNLTWAYPVEDERGEPSGEAVLKEMNGYTWPERKQIDSYQTLKDDGSTACGAWLYCGIFPDENTNKARSRQADGPDGPGTHLNWAFAWPSNRRTMYNRASADARGRPWSERKKMMWWDPAKGQWEGTDSLDFEPTKPPDYEPDWSKKPEGMDAINGRSPFIMIADGRASLFVPSGLKDGPLPTHYEPVESPVKNPLYSQQDNPVAKKWERPDNHYHSVGDLKYPYLLTTYRLTEHHSGATPTRSVPVTAELQPEGFCELPPELARELGIENLDWVTISTARGKIETRAMITRRLRPFEIDGHRIYQVGMFWHFGWSGYATGDIANALTAVVGEPNTTIHENKSLTCNLRKGRIDRSRQFPPVDHAHRLDVVIEGAA
ncbi:MAG TPA: formate dehydrogenase [Pseudolabrys sp.]|nr:formate dehydrogenase [Pseudolabrys sp.]